MRYIFFQDASFMLSDDNQYRLPKDNDLDPMWMKEQRIFPLMGSENTKLLLITTTPNTIEGFSFQEIRAHAFDLDKKDYQLVLEARAINNWDKSHQYCGVCGTKLNPMADNKSKTCSHCHGEFFPEQSCAIIVGITKGDDILLAHNAHFPDNMYSLVAGFVELGEKFEDAVRREIMEEVGIKVKNVTYFNNQSWPFPHSMMIGFTAEYESGEIQVDNDEILDAGWYNRNHMPPSIPRYGSIARTIIDHYLEQTAHHK